jgi:hypothetical protein
MKQDILHSALKEVQLYGDFQSHKAEIDAEDLSWILQILSTNLYSDPIGSLIREYSSNAWDANVEAGNANKPIEVGIQTSKDQGSYWYVTDLGPGLSPQRINDVYRKFGKSTKRENNDAIGMMGLGKFSGLSYTNEVYITTRVDGIQYEYLMHKSDGVPQIDLLISKVTDLPSGTTIRIFIKSWSDKRSFLAKTQEQLAYFENVYFNMDEEPDLNDKFKVYKGKTFTVSTLDTRFLRIKVGPVSYPIDWDIIGTHPVKAVQSSFTGVAINFRIGDIAITPNRESVLYNKQTVENIKTALDMFQTEIIDIYNKQVLEYEDLSEFINSIHNPQVLLGKQHMGVNLLLQACKIPTKHPKIKGLDVDVYPSSESDLFYGYISTVAIQSGRKQDKNYGRTIHGLDKSDTWLYVNKNPLEPRHTKYLCEQKKSNYWYVIRKHKGIKLMPAKDRTNDLCYFNLLKLRRVPKSKWRDTIKKFQDWQAAYIDQHVTKYDDYVPTKDWLKDQKVTSKKTDLRSLRKSQGKVLVKLPEHSYHGGTTFVFRDHNWDISSLLKRRNHIIYGTADDKELLSKLQHYTRLKRLKNVQVIITAKVNHKYFALLPNATEVNKFMKGDAKYFSHMVSMKRLYDVYLQDNEKLKEMYTHIDLIKELNTPFYEKFREMHELFENYKQSSPAKWLAEKDEWVKFYEGMEQVAKEFNLFDARIESLIKEVSEYAAKFEFIKHVACKNGGSNLLTRRDYSFAQVDFAVYVCKKKQVRLNLKHYQNDGRPQTEITQEENQ